jgi:transcriptional regulator with XRE-family HTH domain
VKRIIYETFGTTLKKARKKLHDPETGQRLTVKDMAIMLNVSPGFVYQVEQGIRKPTDGQIDQWANIYEIDSNELWKCLQKIPMFRVAQLRDDSEPLPPSPFAELTKDEQTMLMTYLDYVRWKVNERSSKI